MMKIVEINSVDYGSTGKIMLQIADIIRQSGGDYRIVVPAGRHNSRNNKKNYIFLGNRLAEDSHILLGRITGYQGCFSIISTLILIRALKKYQPDIIHMHNLHNCYINLPILFKYIKRNNIKTVWTLHDCWSFTGHCPYFTLMNCEKWKIGCSNCPTYKSYPESYVDRTRSMWKLKRQCFTGVKNMTIVTPSKWLADLVKCSFLNEYSVKVINNGIDLDVFKPTETDFRKIYSIDCKKYIILGVSYAWEKRKGLDVFLELFKRLDASRYQIVLVGTDDSVDRLLPKSIISIHRTNNQTELAGIYTVANLFVNPTREENYPTVNMEAIACGTPVLTFRTGGSPEIPNEKTGYVVEVDNIEEMQKQIERICSEGIFTKEDCIERAKSFDSRIKYMEYYRLYESVLNNGVKKDE